ncbi:hypothetical protein SAE02_51120 [Skermanella aerolata]|uniref:Uncharacterized protein n=1 Tax=Skermanella aerolata TaxID=393310 RepID=A0A512DWX3_9PROT|nr:2OG-Fe dioxygenase family protein [Skermanella aerolata]KJB93789.1 hypothetical protein N826_14495 [Skermanella aerolata KACC 11604]GEO40964.1 hypothetical protein SAE02_51120 [Skermanella aerolata]
MLLNRATGELVITKSQLHDGQEVEIYFQSSANNNDRGNRERYFPVLPAELRINMAVHWLVRRPYQAIPSGTLRESLWLSVGLHIVQLQPAPSHDAQPSPPWLHRDGEAVTYIVLMNREGVTGGINYVTTPRWVNHQPEEVPPQDLLAQTTLTAPLDGLGVIDERVAHHVTSVRHAERGGSVPERVADGFFGVGSVPGVKRLSRESHCLI